MMRRREVIAGLGGAAVWPLAAGAQQPALPLVGWLGVGTSVEDARGIIPVTQGLAGTGFVERRDFAFEYRWAEYHLDRLPELAADLVSRRVAAVITPTTAATLAAKAATQTIPILFAVGIDPVAFGLVASFNRPGGNVTGFFNFGSVLAAKRLEVLHELVPAAGLFAVLVNPRGPLAESETKELQDASALLGVRLLIVNATVPDEFESAFATIVQQRAGALLVSGDPMFSNRADQLVALASRHAVPTIYRSGSAVTAGGLMSYTVNFADNYRQLGVYVGRILKGEKPSDLPVQQATKIELVINMKTAKALGLTFPRTILGRAAAVIE
jgi:putative tryptophan/tyrosine transport system substrate-binding protein